MMKKWLIIAVAGIFLFPTVSSGAGDPPRSHRKVVSVVDEKRENSGWLGVTIATVTEKLAKEKNLGTEEGALIEDVADESPADSAGIQKGDVIVECNGKKITDSDDLRNYIGNSSPGSKVSIVLLRNGEKKTLSAILGTAKDFKHQIRIPHPMPMKNCMPFCQKPRLGMNLESLNEQLGEYFGAPNGEGVLVREVHKKSLAEKAGFKAGDVIVRVGKKSVDEVSDIRKILQKAEPGETLVFEIIRKGSPKTISVPIEKNEEEAPSGCQFDVPETPFWESDGEFFEIPERDIDIHIDEDKPPKFQEMLNRLMDELGKMKIEKDIKIRVQTNDI
jgi:membrane-associated protease RseP (regulator of RpoE activity)